MRDLRAKEAQSMAYADVDFKTKRAFKEAIAAGQRITLWSPGFWAPKREGREHVEGPQYPKPHSWYATVEMHEGYVVKVK